MQTAILLYDGMTVLDAIGPYEVLQSVPGIDVHFVARTKGEKRADFKRLGLVADFTLSEVPRRAIWPPLPGNSGCLPWWGWRMPRRS